MTGAGSTLGSAVCVISGAIFSCAVSENSVSSSGVGCKSYTEGKTQCNCVLFERWLFKILHITLKVRSVNQLGLSLHLEGLTLKPSPLHKDEFDAH